MSIQSDPFEVSKGAYCAPGTAMAKSAGSCGCPGKECKGSCDGCERCKRHVGKSAVPSIPGLSLGTKKVTGAGKSVNNITGAFKRKLVASAPKNSKKVTAAWQGAGTVRKSDPFELAKNDLTQSNASTGRKVTGTVFGVYHGLAAGRKGHKLRAAGNQFAGGVAGGVVGKLGATALTRGRSVGAAQAGGLAGAAAGTLAGTNRAQNKGHFKPQNRG